MKKRWKYVAAAVLLLVGAAVWHFFLRGPEPAPPLATVSEGLNIKSLDAYLAMFSLVRDALTKYPDVKKALDIPRDPDLPELCDRPVVVSIYRENSPPLWGVGTSTCMADLDIPNREGCLHDAILCAAYQISLRREFKKFYLLKLDEVTVRVDIVNQLAPFHVSKKNLSKQRHEPGVFGLILQNGKRLTFQPPFSYLVHSWERDDQSRTDRLRFQLGELADAAGVGRGGWTRYPLYQFNCFSVLQHRPDFMPVLLLRDAPVIKKFTSQDIGRAAIDAGRHLRKNFDFQQQRFRYRFNPITMKKGEYLEYEEADHAGAVYALLKLYKASRKDEFFDVGQSSLDYLVKHTEPPLLEPDWLAVQRFHMAKLGASALTLLAANEMPPKLLQRVGVDRINRLARFLVEMQETDGSFYDFYWQRLLGYEPRKRSTFFAGEALLALARYYKNNQNVDWLLAARRAAARQIDEFNKRRVPNPWVIQGLAELYTVDPNPLYADTVLAMADALRETQWGNPAYGRNSFADYQGGFSGQTPPRTATAARNIEGLLAAHWLAHKLEKDPQPYADAVLRAVHFVLQNQYRRDNTYYVNRPEETRGAFRGSPIDPEIHLAYNYHAIVALTGAYDVAAMVETGKIPEEFKAEGTKELEDSMQMGGKAE